ncbi:hypothetical protein A4H97_14805 [Niastella yeongjuensis]|uniref:Uncharacterized protein n=1 Tax=Niastella yeongjuensis TaxID=354355 RepID=A0A1V9E454_9BACT|nr:hypothetical protein [Niastella yeongjuensis]OQP40876.1 hypothetical protein A4H97_14805 [Niastella yeongjuensis]SEO99185.1 hypothetical protein SAMN05660816_04090 [Niastella yeongjuensis]
MKRILQNAFLFAVVCNCWNVVQAQKTENYSLQCKNVKIAHAGFSKVEVIDSRYDTVHIGSIQRGMFNRKGLLTLSQSLKDEIAAAANKLVDEADTKVAGTLLINLRKFFISEHTTATEEGLFTIKAGFYYKQDSLYKEMFTIDTTYRIKAGLGDVTERLLDTVPSLLGLLVRDAANYNFTTGVLKNQYTGVEIQHLTEIEKMVIPVYNVPAAKKGLYATAADFMNNHPTREDVIIQLRKGFSRPFIYEMTEDGKKGKEILRKYYYVISDGDKMFLSRPNNLYELTKKEGDFYFTGVGKDDADMGSVAVGYALLGVLGGATAANHDTAIFEFILDHSTGKFIPIRKIKD